MGGNDHSGGWCDDDCGWGMRRSQLCKGCLLGRVPSVKGDF